MDFRFSLVGLLVGVLVGLTGMGGGSLLAPIMILVFRVPPVWAVGTDVAYSTITKACGSLVHIRQKSVDFRVALWLACGSVPATLLSVSLVQYIRHQMGNAINELILHAIGFTLLLVAALMVARPLIINWLDKRNLEARKQRVLAGAGSVDEHPSRWQRVYRPMVTIFVGAFVGFLVGLTSVGSGTLIIVVMAFLFPRLTAKELVGTDVFQAFMLLAAGTIGYLAAGTINWTLVGLLLIGSIPGVLIGSRLSKYVPDRILRSVLAIVLVISGWKLI